jgi:hypothetical protein
MVTVGPPLPIQVREGINYGCERSSCVLTNTGSMNGASDTSPVDGVILRWTIYHGAPYSFFRLRVLTRLGAGYIGAGRSASEFSVREGAIETFPTHLPIQAGQLIGLELENENSSVQAGYSPGSGPVFVEPAMADGVVGYPSPWGGSVVFPFNVEILPTPTIAAIRAGRGPSAGGNQVTITGENFAEVNGVSFGSTGANYTVDSESQITATVPAGSAASSVAVSVATAAGRAEAATVYDYEPLPAAAPAPVPPPVPAPGCSVPKLQGKRLASVRRLLVRDGCRLGRVQKRQHVTGRSGRVKSQRPLPGAALPSGSRVEVTLGATS